MVQSSVRVGLCGLLLTASAACGGSDVASDRAAVTTQPSKVIDTQSAPAAAVTALQMQRFNCGELDVLDMSQYDRDGSLDGVEGAIASTCWLVRHPNGDLVWELGLPTGLAGQSATESPPYIMYLEQTLSDQLQVIGLSARDIDYVAFSANQFELTGQADQFPQAVWLTTEAEEAALFPPASDPDVDTEVSEAVAFAEMAREVFADELDVFGDGSVKLMSMPGPTAGHKILWVDLPQTGPVILPGALFYSEAALEQGFIPRFFADETATATSQNAVKTLADSTGARILISADFDHLANVPEQLN